MALGDAEGDNDDEDNNDDDDDEDDSDDEEEDDNYFDEEEDDNYDTLKLIKATILITKYSIQGPSKSPNLQTFRLHYDLQHPTVFTAGPLRGRK
ncbi:hypothetical protein ElyMa_003662900 [Elysia marginata]|uniref:Uncharacterized protein n=1 Tax=Elysia marginata TaxID=1093978 RepID=A0AAV4EWR0_9GAST|nr:hypothetical protein ElyMa_003662900 [Elysia marginata]